MRKVFILSVCAAVLLSGCGTYAGSGAFTGAHFGSILGSAIGGITDGPRGHDVGTIIGMAGGAVIGAAIGSAADDNARRDRHEHYEAIQRRKAAEQRQNNRRGNYNEGTGYDNGNYYDPTNSGDDRLYDFQSSDYTDNYSASSPRSMSPSTSSIEEISSGYSVNTDLVIRNPRFVDGNRDGQINSNEVSKVIFEVYNASNRTLYDLQPTVVEATGRRNIFISPTVHVEKLAPGKAIRYTAMVKSAKMKDGTATFCLSVLQGGRTMSDVTEFTINTVR